jgi:hypothetical protein
MKVPSLVLLVAVCAFPAAAQAPDTVINSIRAETTAAAQARSVWLTSTDRQCAQLATSEAHTDAALQIVMQWSARLSSPSSGRTSQWLAGKVLDAGGPIVASSMLQLGDTYMAGKCVTEAKRVYQQVIATFTGSNYTAYRELASEGLADIRAL